MKNILLIITLIAYSVSQGQIINIPNVNFKNALLNASNSYHIANDINGNWITIDTNNDNEIQISEALTVYSLNVSNISINTLQGIEGFSNLQNLICGNCDLTSLDVSNNEQLIFLDCSYNFLNTLNINTLTLLSKLYCRHNNLNTLNLENNPQLIELKCNDNNINDLNLSNNSQIIELNCNNNNINSLSVNNILQLTKLNCGSNQINSLDINNNSQLIELDCSDNNINILNVDNNLMLTELNCRSNNLNSLNIDNNIHLTLLKCYNNFLMTLNVNNNVNLSILNCSQNNLTYLDTYNNLELSVLKFYSNNLTNIDVSNNSNLITFNCSNNYNLEYINLKNGNNNNLITTGNYLTNCNFNNLSNLQTICIDDLNSTIANFITEQVESTVIITVNCKNEISGNIKFDISNNNCTASNLNASNLMITTNNSFESLTTFTQSNGDYLLYTNEGDFSTSVTTNLPNYFTINPNEQTNTFTGFNNTFTADFCIEPNQTVNDVNISLIPTNQTRPGFNATYQIIYKNVGTTQLNGNVTLEFDETKLSFLNASETVNTQTSNSLTFNYTNLNPFETRIIDLEFIVFTPPTVEIDDILTFTSTINPIASDFTEDDNIFELNQTVVGSFDPNDITVLEGNQILLADADKYLHYVIRFQNTGTASAINVVVTNNLDANLDWSTLQLESLSHNNRVAIKNGNEIEFIFENINLPDSTTDEPNSHGFIAYKIKPKADIVLGDVIPNKADIFFDFNEAIETNTATTTIVNALAVNENTLLDFSVYPTPTENLLNVKSKTEIIKIEIYSKLGQLMLKNTTENKIDISNLTQGLYFAKVEDVNGNFGIKKIVKK